MFERQVNNTVALTLKYSELHPAVDRLSLGSKDPDCRDVQTPGSGARCSPWSNSLRPAAFVIIQLSTFFPKQILLHLKKVFRYES